MTKVLYYKLTKKGRKYLDELNIKTKQGDNHDTRTIVQYSEYNKWVINNRPKP